MQGIIDAGFTYCTPIQAQTLPLALQGRDVAGQAQTGTGKTAAFLVALFQSLLSKPGDRTARADLDPRADRRARRVSSRCRSTRMPRARQAHRI